MAWVMADARRSSASRTRHSRATARLRHVCVASVKNYNRQEKQSRLHERIKLCENWRQVRYLLDVSARVCEYDHGVAMLGQLSCIQLRSRVRLATETHPAETMMMALQLATRQDLLEYQPNELATLIASFGALGVLDPGLLRMAVAHSSPALDRMSTRPLAGVLHALVKLGYPVCPEWMAAYRRSFAARLASCDEKALYAVLLALPFTGCPQPASLLRKLEAALLGRFDSFTIQQLLAMSSSIHRMGHAPSDVYARAFCAALARGSWAQLTAREAAHTVQLLASYAAASAEPVVSDRAAGVLLQRVVVPQLAGCSMEDVCVVLSAAAHRCSCGGSAAGLGSGAINGTRSGVPKWVRLVLPKAMAACRGHLRDCKDPALILQALSAVAHLGAKPSLALAERLLSALFGVLHVLDLRALLAVMKGLAAMGTEPSSLWMGRYWAIMAMRLEAGCGVEELVEVGDFVRGCKGVEVPAGVLGVLAAQMESYLGRGHGELFTGLGEL